MQNKTKHLILIPSSDVSKLEDISSYLCLHDSLTKVMLHDLPTKIDTGLTVNNVGLFIIDPAQRLKKAYLSTLEVTGNQNLSFRDFYTDPTRVNLYSRYFSKFNVSEIGYIGVQEHYYKSVLLFQEWLGGILHRLPYNDGAPSAFNESITTEEQIEIGKIYAKDIAFYDRLVMEFKSRWLAYAEASKVPLGGNKRAIVHLGPPKTGTSAIQSWLNEHSNTLASQGIYYPTHLADENGVSSGNFEYLITVNSVTGKAFFNDVRLKETVAEFQKSGCETLLFSSEHFFYYLLWLFTRLPNAEFIFYIRHPLAVIESEFHQQVKRHRRTTPYTVPVDVEFSALKKVQSMATTFNCNVNYRFFDSSLFEGKTLLRDFSHTLNVAEISDIKGKRLNTQYSPGSLALMMYCNEFASDSLLHQLDIFLQKHSETYPAYSLMTSDQYDHCIANIETKISALEKSFSQVNRKKLRQLLANYRLPGTCDAKTKELDLLSIFEMLSKTPLLNNRLYIESRNKNSALGAQEVHEKLILTQGEKFKLEFKQLIDRIKSIFFPSIEN